MKPQKEGLKGELSTPASGEHVPLIRKAVDGEDRFL